jgi:nicotinate-nucleotide pyrophosphorylase (carboxylating)
VSATPALQPLLYRPLLAAALREDLGTAGDLTTDAVVEATATASGLIVARAPGRVACLDVAVTTFSLLDGDVTVERCVDDGADVDAGTVMARLHGSARAILTGERVALNVLGRLCGVATATARFVDRIGDRATRVVPTRKTTPGLRALERHAVRCGGGVDHRFGLADGVLIKDNHIAVAGGITTAVARVRARVGHMVRVEVEVDTLDQLDEAVALPIDAVLLDNFTSDDLVAAVARTPGHIVTEASGGVTLDTVGVVADAGVDLVSVGWLTHSAPALDVALDFAPG